ncbi:MAG: HigA family addiction module antitoxin [Gammaproteobacteria bacterium]|nr:HigA family addiction module antitoxin [Gammaproteobacteria bacterium]
MAMKDPPHPGSVFRQVCIDPIGLTVTEAATHLGVSRRQLSDVVNGRSGISPEMAVRISKVFGGSAQIWCRMQAAYDLARTLERADTIKVGRLRPVAT